METDHLIAQLDHIEAEAYVEMVAAAPSAFVAATGIRTVRVRGATLILAPRMPISLFNRVVGLGVDEPATEGQLDEILATFRAAGVRECWIHRGPATRPAALPEWMAARGLALAKRPTWAKLARGTEEPPASNPALEVREIDRAGAALFGDVISRAFGMRPETAEWIASVVGRAGFRTYLVWDGGTPIGGGLYYASGATAWLGLGGTLAEHRNRGGQGAVLSRRIRDAIAGGATTLCSETGEPIEGEQNPSLANLCRYGFRKVCARENWSVSL